MSLSEEIANTNDIASISNLFERTKLLLIKKLEIDKKHELKKKDRDIHKAVFNTYCNLYRQCREKYIALTKDRNTYTLEQFIIRFHKTKNIKFSNDNNMELFKRSDPEVKRIAINYSLDIFINSFKGKVPDGILKKAYYEIRATHIKLKGKTQSLTEIEPKPLSNNDVNNINNNNMENEKVLEDKDEIKNALEELNEISHNTIDEEIEAELDNAMIVDDVNLNETKDNTEAKKSYEEILVKRLNAESGDAEQVIEETVSVNSSDVSMPDLVTNHSDEAELPMAAEEVFVNQEVKEKSETGEKKKRRVRSLDYIEPKEGEVSFNELKPNERLTIIKEYHLTNPELKAGALKEKMITDKFINFEYADVYHFLNIAKKGI